MNKSYYPSGKKVSVIVSIFIILFFLIFGFSRGSFEVQGALWGLAFGLIFSLIIIFIGYGQMLTVTPDFVIFAPDFLARLIKTHLQQLKLSEVNKVRIGVPERNVKATFAAVNIATDNGEISFNPDLFDKQTLQSFFQAMRQFNSKIEFDAATREILDIQGSGQIGKIVGKNFLNLLLFYVVSSAIVLFLHLFGMSDTKILFVLGILLFISPFAYQKLFPKK